MKEQVIREWQDSNKASTLPDGEEQNIVLRPALNSNVSHLSVLSHSYHTLSPYTRSVEHFAVRSGPPREDSQPLERPPPKARRKRMYKVGLGTNRLPVVDHMVDRRHTISPSPPSDCELSDREHYFRSPSHIRHRAPYQDLGKSEEVS